MASSMDATPNCNRMRSISTFKDLVFYAIISMKRLWDGDVRDLETLNAELDRWSGDRLLSTGTYLLELFIGANFTGCSELRSCLSEVYGDGSGPFREVCMKELSFDFNRPFKHARLAELLWLSKLMLLDREKKIADTSERNICVCRCLQLWQCLLDEPAMQLKQIADRKEEEILSSEQGDSVTSEFHLERMYAHLGYYEYDKAERHLKDAIEKAHLSVQLSGVLGRRTRFQLTNIPQLVAEAFSSVSLSDKDSTEDAQRVKLPTNVRLDDDTLLEGVSILADDLNNGTRLTAVQLACILGICAFETSTQHNDELLLERCSAYVDKVISQASNWAIYTCALLRRCALEKQSRRRIQRACSQAELIAKIMDAVDDKSSPEEKRRRNVLVLASGLSPSWRVHAFHAQLLRSLGCTAEALRIYEKQEAWDNVIECYKSLGQLEKAERLVRELIANDDRDHPLYYCMLGDITLEPNYYKVAIEKSKGRYARAHLSLGELMMIRHRYDIAYESLRRGLELQPIKLGAWFNLGHCAWKMEHWHDAACAYHRCVQLEPEHFEAWNNLSAAYTRLGQKPRAKKILQEALKFNYDHTRMWENYVLLCVDTRDIAGTIQALHRLIDLDGKHQDDEVISIVTAQLLECRDKNHDSVDQLVNEMCKLLARMTSKQTCSSKLWRCYAALQQPHDGDCSIARHEKYLNLLERAYLADYNNQKWYTEEEQCCNVLKMATDIFEEKLNLAKLKDVDPKSVMSEVRMRALPLLAMVERVYGKDASNAVSADLRQSFASIKQFVEGVISR